MPSPTSTLRSRQVSSELRRLRQERGISGAELALRLGMSESKVSRIETGERGLQLTDVAAILGLLQVPAKRREELLEMVSCQDRSGWSRSKAEGLPVVWRDFIELEARAERISNFELALVPGLVQTPEYSAAIIRGVNREITDDVVRELVEARRARQRILRDPDKRFSIAIDEGVLHRPIGVPGVMYRQLRYLADVAHDVGFRVVPASAGAYYGLCGAFMLLDFPREPSVAYYENHGGSRFPEAKEDVADYRSAMRDILDIALSPRESAELINAIADESPRSLMETAHPPRSPENACRLIAAIERLESGGGARHDIVE